MAGATPTNPVMFVFIAITALCWGVYGPLLNWGQMEFGGSRLRAFLMVGVAYLLVAVLAPLVILQFSDDTKVEEGGNRWPSKGISWSLIAGTAGAIGALGIILAYNKGGTPVTVMPIVFGFAPVISTLFTISTNNWWSRTGPAFYAGIGFVILGTVMALKFAPHPGPPKPKPAEPAVEVQADLGAANPSSATK
ncbi:MAG: hypothetical protein ACKOBW_11050 [Planctomycetota bacterium]